MLVLQMAVGQAAGLWLSALSAVSFSAFSALSLRVALSGLEKRRNESTHFRIRTSSSSRHQALQMSDNVHCSLVRTRTSLQLVHRHDSRQ